MIATRIIYSQMGIKGLRKHLRERHPEVFERVPLETWRGRRVGIDLFSWIYRNAYSAHKSASRTRDILYEAPDPGTTVNYLIGLLVGYLSTYLQAGVTPVILIDGAPPAAKAGTREERKARRTDVEEKHATLKAKLQSQSMDNLEEMTEEQIEAMEKEAKQLKTYDQQLFSVAEHLDAIYDVIGQMGIPMEKATGEAEKMGAMLCIDGYVDAMATTDMDALVLGCPEIIESFERPARKGKRGTSQNDAEAAQHEEKGEPVTSVAAPTGTIAVCLRLEVVLHVLGLSYPQFVDLGILAGCDYNKNLPGLAIVGAYKWIQRSGSLAQVLVDYPAEHAATHERKARTAERKGQTVAAYVAPDLGILNVAEARACFAYEPSSTLFAEAEEGDERTIVERLTIIDRDAMRLTESLEAFSVRDYSIRILLRGLTSDDVRNPMMATVTRPPPR